MEEELESLEAILLEGRHGLVEIGQPQLRPASAAIRREGLQSADLLPCLTGRAVQANGGQVQCGAVWLNGDAAHCQHLGRPLHGADAELERHDMQ